MAVANTRRGQAHGPVLEATDARQGRRGLHVLWILVISLALAGIALSIILAIQAPGLSGPGGQVTSQKATATQPLAQPRQTDNESH